MAERGFSMSRRSLGNVSHGIGAALKGLVQSQGRQAGEEYARAWNVANPVIEQGDWRSEAREVGKQQDQDYYESQKAKIEEMRQSGQLDETEYWNAVNKNESTFAQAPGRSIANPMRDWLALLNKHADRVDLSGFGSTSDYDVNTGQYYHRGAGEVAPGRRGSVSEWSDPNAAYGVTQQQNLNPTKGGWFTQSEWGKMAPNRQAQTGLNTASRMIAQQYGGY